MSTSYTQAAEQAELEDYLTKNQDLLHKMTLEGLADIEAGRVIPHEEVVKKFKQWGKPLCTKN